MPIMNCCCTTDCYCTSDDGDSLIVAGDQYNANYTVLRIGGTGDAAAPFPRYPRFSLVSQEIIPCVDMAIRVGVIICYPGAIKHDGTYDVNEKCRNIYKATYKPAKCLTGGAAYGSGNNTIWAPHEPHYPLAFGPPGTAIVKDVYSTYRSVENPPPTGIEPGRKKTDDPASRPIIPEVQPLVWKNGTRLETRPNWGAIDFTAFDANYDLSWFTLTSSDKSIIAGLSTAADNEPHTLILYMSFWRSRTKTIVWNTSCVPAWWAGAFDDSIDYSGGDVPIGEWAGDPLHQNSYGDCVKYPSWKHNQGKGRYAGGPTGERVGTDVFGVCQDSDSRAILLSVHTAAQQPNVLIQAAQVYDGTHWNFILYPRTGRDGYMGDVWPPGSTLDMTGALQGLLVCAAGSQQAIGLPPIVNFVTGGTGWMDVGEPVSTCTNGFYQITLTFTGSGTATFTWGEITYTIVR